MKALLTIAAIVGALFYFKPNLFSFDFSSGSFDSAGNPKVRLFTFDGCGQWCNKGINELERRQVDFEEVNVEASETNKALYAEMGKGAMPYLVFGKSKISGFNKDRYATQLAQIYGDKYLTRLERRYYGNHFYDDNSPLIYMYGASWCQYCKKMREEFIRQDLDFVEIDVELSDDPALLARTMGIGGYPVIFVGYQRIEATMDVGKIIDATKVAIKRKI